MIRSMQPVIATAVRNRLPLPLITLAIALFAPAFASGRVEWFESEIQAVFAAVLYVALIPLLVIAVASTWLRGDDGPWAWALARPVTRGRWLRATLLVDALTLLACIALTRWVVGQLPDQWFGAWDGETRPYAYAALITTIYASAAFGGARGATAIGASLYVVAAGAMTAALHACAEIGATAAFETQIWRIAADEWPSGPRFGDGDGDLELFSSLPSLPTLVIAAGFAVAAVGGAAARLPARPGLQPLLRPMFIAAIGVAVLSASITIVRIAAL